METLPHEEQKKTLSAAERFLYWIKKHLTKVVFGTGFFILILGGTALLWMSRRREKRESESPDKVQAPDQPSVSLHSLSLKPTRTKSSDTRMGRFTSIPSVDKSSSCSSSVMDGNLSFKAMDL